MAQYTATQYTHYGLAGHAVDLPELFAHLVATWGTGHHEEGHNVTHSNLAWPLPTPVTMA